VNGKIQPSNSCDARHWESFSINAWSKIMVRCEQRVGFRWISAYKKTAPRVSRNSDRLALVSLRAFACNDRRNGYAFIL